MTVSWGVVLVWMIIAFLSTTLSTFSCQTFRIVHSELNSFNATTDAIAFGFRKKYINGQCQAHDFGNSVDVWLQFGVGAWYSVISTGCAFMSYAAAMTHSLAAEYYSEFERRMGRLSALRVCAKMGVAMAVVVATLLVGLGSSTYCSAKSVTCRVQATKATEGFGIVAALALWLATACAAKIGLYFETQAHEHQLVIPKAPSRGFSHGENHFVSALWIRLSRAWDMYAPLKRPSCHTVKTTDTVRGPDGLDMQRVISTTRIHGCTVVRETRERMHVPETTCDNGNAEMTLTGPFLLSMETLIVTKANMSSTTTSMFNYTAQVTCQRVTLQRREMREFEVNTRMLAKLEPFHAQALAGNLSEATLHGTIPSLPNSQVPMAETTTTLRRRRTTTDHSAMDSLTSTNPISVTGGDQVSIERTVVIYDTMVPKQEREAQITDQLCTVEERTCLA
jgi:hypothetical protein